MRWARDWLSAAGCLDDSNAVGDRAGEVRAMVQLTSMMAFSRFELTVGQRFALDDVSARVPST